VVISCYFPVASQEELRGISPEPPEGQGKKDGIILSALMARFLV